MIELRPNITAAGYTESTIDAQIAYGGDTLNAATYLGRQGLGVDYFTVLGDDPLSDWIVILGNRESCCWHRGRIGSSSGLKIRVLASPK